MANILFVAAGRRVGMATLFKNAGATVFAYELEDDCPIAKVAKKVIIAEKFRPLNYKEDVYNLNNVCKTHSIDLIIPFSCESSAWLYSHQLNISATCLTSFGSRVCFDKECFMNWFKGKSLFDFYPWPELGEFASFKPSTGCGGDGVYFEKYKGMCPDGHVAQRHLKEPEYSVDAYYSKAGNFVSAVVREREFVAAGEILESIVVDKPELIKIIREIGEVISFSGPICAQFMDVQSKPKITEINCRFGGGAPLAIYAGLNMVNWILFEYIYGGNLELMWPEAFKSEIKVGTKTRRHYQDNFFN